MDRRQFLHNLAATTAGISYLSETGSSGSETLSSHAPLLDEPVAQAPDTQGHTLVGEFSLRSLDWKVYEDLRTRDGAITFLSSEGHVRILPKSAEAVFADASPAYLGLSLDDIGVAGADLLADHLLDGGADPDPERVKSAVPPQGSASDENERWRLPWNAIVGTKECFDTMPVFPNGATRTYHPVQYFPEITRKAAEKRWEGLIGGWMPAVRKVIPVEGNPESYVEVVVFGDVQARDKFIVQTWHRTSKIENGKISKVAYGYSYPAFPQRRKDPSAADFYRALLVFAEYWDKQLSTMANVSLPKKDWVDLSKHAFAKELMVRPGGVYPKYGAVDRDYYGSEYDGFQDIFTMAICANLEWGRCAEARQILDNYFSDFVDDLGMINMRGPETAQFGLTLSLLARYFRYTRDVATLRKHRKKIAATAELLVELHEAALKLPENGPGYGLIHGWSESDSCLMPNPNIWWLPYYANSAFAARGLRDIANAWPALSSHDSSQAHTTASSWKKHAEALQAAVVRSIEKNVRRDMQPPYIGTYPGAQMLFRESLEKEHPSPQGWPHRPYAELLQADVLPPELAHLVINCMRAYGATTLGVVANVGPARKGERAILGFISYGYAQMLLRLDRIEEYLLFLYAHRFHDHTRGSWTAGEVSGIDGGTALFCIPAQQTIPLLVRWMLLLEDSDEDRLYFAKGIPREWLASGKEIRLSEALTSWGKVSFSMKLDPAQNSVVAKVNLSNGNAPKEIHVKLRLPLDKKTASVTVNGKPAQLVGTHKDTVVIATRDDSIFEVIARVRQCSLRRQTKRRQNSEDEQ
jgi:hypothetical protein